MIAGRNRMMRKMIMDSITTDPEWKGGEYAAQPRGLIHALHVLTIMSSSALQAQKRAPDRDQADKALNDYIAGRAKDADANDLLYQVAASREYNPEPKLATIRAPLLAVNSADDVINPPELGILERDSSSRTDGPSCSPSATRRAGTGRTRSRPCGSSTWSSCSPNRGTSLAKLERSTEAGLLFHVVTDMCPRHPVAQGCLPHASAQNRRCVPSTPAGI